MDQEQVQLFDAAAYTLYHSPVQVSYNSDWRQFRQHQRQHNPHPSVISSVWTSLSHGRAMFVVDKLPKAAAAARLSLLGLRSNLTLLLGFLCSCGRFSGNILPSALRTRLEAQNEMAIKGMQRAVSCILFLVTHATWTFSSLTLVKVHKGLVAARHTLGLQHPNAAILLQLLPCLC